jgi:hypothetical protein
MAGPHKSQMIESPPYRTVHILRAGNAPLFRPGRARPAASIEIHLIYAGLKLIHFVDQNASTIQMQTEPLTAFSRFTSFFSAMLRTTWPQHVAKIHYCERHRTPGCGRHSISLDLENKKREPTTTLALHPSPGGVAQLVERVLYHSTRRAVPERSWVQSLLPTTEVEPGFSTFGGMLVPVLQLISPVCKTGTSLYYTCPARAPGVGARRGPTGGR